MSKPISVQVLERTLAIELQSIATGAVEISPALYNRLMALNTKVEGVRRDHPDIMIQDAEKLTQCITQLFTVSGSSSSSSEEEVSSEEQLVEFSVEMALAPGESIAICFSDERESVELRRVDEGTCRLELRGLYLDTRYKFVLNGSNSEEGPYHRVGDGDVLLQFPGRYGKLTMDARDFYEVIASRVNLLSPTFPRQAGIEGFYSRDEFVLWDRYIDEGKMDALIRLTREMPMDRSDEIIPILVAAFQKIQEPHWKNEFLIRLVLLRRRARSAESDLFEELFVRMEGSLPECDRLYLSVARLEDPDFMQAILQMLVALPDQWKINTVIEVLAQMEPYRDSFLLRRLPELFFTQMFPFVFQTDALKMALLGQIVEFGSRCECPSYRSILEQFAKELYEALAPEMQTKLRWNIFLANNRSTVVGGVERGDLGRYVINHAIFSPLCLQGARLAAG